MNKYAFGLFALCIALLMSACAKMGQPDGGWYDETPPRVIATYPQDGDVHVNNKKIAILFSEFIKLDNASEKVVVSPPQLITPEIKGQGKRITVSLEDSLMPNTTYTIDFSDAISDNNEGNPLGNYTYTFSTGGEIDTMQVAGYVLDAQNLEPVKGILVGLYSNLNDSAFQKLPMLRVARTDSRGYFSIKGVKEGDYRVYALQDQDANFRFSQKSEAIAFTPEIFTTSARPDIRQDTIWADSLHIKSIDRVGYTHFYPDDVILTSFTQTLTTRYLAKFERPQADHFTLYYGYGDKDLPQISGLNFDAQDAFIIEPSAEQDTITYWLRDTTLVNQDTLSLAVTHNITDTLGVLRQQTDTLNLISKEPYAKRLKLLTEERQKWEKKQKRREERGKSFLTVMPPKALELSYHVESTIDPDANPSVTMNTPLSVVDTTKIHLYQKIDTLWYNAKFLFGQRPGSLRDYTLVGEWTPGIEYSLEIDSAAFVDIYGKASVPHKQGFKVRATDEYATLSITLQNMDGKHCLVQLLNGQDNVVKVAEAQNNEVNFFYVKPATYYLRLIVDDNDNGKWDTGNYDKLQQAEAVYYYPKGIECRAKWDISEKWNPKALPLHQQKPSAITKQKADKKKTVRNLNAERAQKLGIALPEYLQRKQIQP